MKGEVINEYITKKYSQWLDYTQYHCSRHGMEDEAIDVLNEVLFMFLQKFQSDQDLIIKLYEKKKDNYRELDFFILKMIKLNVYSETSPYRYKYKSVPVDRNVDFQILNMIDEPDEEIDDAGNILNQMHKIREVLDELHLSDKAKEIFSFKFFQGESLSDWKGKEDRKHVRHTYNQVLKLIKNKIKNNIIF